MGIGHFHYGRRGQGAHKRGAARRDRAVDPPSPCCLLAHGVSARTEPRSKKRRKEADCGVRAAWREGADAG